MPEISNEEIHEVAFRKIGKRTLAGEIGRLESECFGFSRNGETAEGWDRVIAAQRSLIEFACILVRAEVERQTEELRETAIELEAELSARPI